MEFKDEGEVGAQNPCTGKAEGCALLSGLTAELEAERERSEVRLQAIQAAANAMFIVDSSGRIDWVNPAFTKITGFSTAEALGKNPRFLKLGLHDQEAYEQRWQQAAHAEAWKGWTINRHKDGHLYHVEESITPILASDGMVKHYVVVYEDITNWVEAEARAVRAAMFDPLTDLPNRMLFWQKFHDALARLQRLDRHLAVLVVDLDGFKEINDSLGHASGDLLVVEVGRRFRSCLRGTDTLARLGGDEFAILLEMLHQPDEAAMVAQRLLDLLAEPIQIEEHRVNISASIGVTLVPGDEPDADGLLKHAELAMYEAKKKGRNCFQFFSQQMDELAKRRREMEVDLKEGLARGQFWLAYQPKLDLVSGKIRGAEALMRWRHPVRGFVSPAEFIPLAERTRLILGLGDWVLKEALRQVAAWKRGGVGSLPVAVNFSAVQFERPDLGLYLDECLRAQGLDSEMLEIEITESVMVSPSATVNQNLVALERMGIAVAVDDFGIGYSSLKYLREFPVKRLKVDMSFVQGIGKDRRDEAIVDAVIGLAHSLKLEAIAEGVETREHYDYLKKRGCDMAQGYLIGRPMPAADMAAVLMAESA